MDWKTIATIALGLAAAALAALVPATAPYAGPAAALLIGTALPQPKHWAKKPEGGSQEP